MTTTTPSFFCRQSVRIRFVREQQHDTGLNVYFPDLNFYLYYWSSQKKFMVSPGSVCFNLNWDSPCGIYAVKPNICCADAHVELTSSRPLLLGSMRNTKPLVIKSSLELCKTFCRSFQLHGFQLRKWVIYISKKSKKSQGGISSLNSKWDPFCSVACVKSDNATSFKGKFNTISLSLPWRKWSKNSA